MKIIDQNWSWEHFPEDAYSRIERIARTCYRSEIGAVPLEDFVRMLVEKGHTPMLDHIHVSLRFVTNRGVSHEMVRHRLAAYAQESTRYCNYDRDRFGKELTFVRPFWWDAHPERISFWVDAAQTSEEHYLTAIRDGWPAQAARDLLPIGIKTEIVATWNFTECLHVFRLRGALAAHPQFRALILPVIAAFRQHWPVIFGEPHARAGD
jgi:thymidylate synthase (FAD)